MSNTSNRTLSYKILQISKYFEFILNKIPWNIPFRKILI